MSGVKYGRGLAQGYRGLGDVHSKPFNVSTERWDEIFGKKKDVTIEPTSTERAVAEGCDN